MNLNNKKLKMTKNRGITLVALVVTIVILIILATISISETFGEHGLIAKIRGEEQDTKSSIEGEQIKLNELKQEYADATIEIYTCKIKYCSDEGEVLKEETKEVQEGTLIPYNKDNIIFNEENYIYESGEDKKATAKGDTISITYTKDELVDKGITTTNERGDGIPDKCQVTLYFYAVNGSISHDKAVITKYDDSGNPSQDGVAVIRDSDIPVGTPAPGYDGSGSWSDNLVSGGVVDRDYTYAITFAPKGS